MSKFDDNDNDSLMLSDIRELLWILASDFASNNDPVDQLLYEFEVRRMNREPE